MGSAARFAPVPTGALVAVYGSQRLRWTRPAPPVPAALVARSRDVAAAWSAAAQVARLLAERRASAGADR